MLVILQTNQLIGLPNKRWAEKSVMTVSAGFCLWLFSCTCVSSRENTRRSQGAFCLLSGPTEEKQVLIKSLWPSHPLEEAAVQSDRRLQTGKQAFSGVSIHAWLKRSFLVKHVSLSGETRRADLFVYYSRASLLSPQLRLNHCSSLCLFPDDHVPAGAGRDWSCHGRELDLQPRLIISYRRMI